MIRSSYKNRYLNWLSRETSWLLARNLCNFLNLNTKKVDFKRAAENGFMGCKMFWSIAKAFLTRAYHEGVSVCEGGGEGV